MNFVHDKRHKKEKGNGFLPERRSAGPVSAISLLHSYPLSLAALDSSPKGAPLGYAGNFTVTTKAVPLDRLSPAGERCRVSDRVGNGWQSRRL